MKTFKPILLGLFVLISGAYGTCFSQEKSIIDEYPELRKPVVQADAAEIKAPSPVKITAVCSETKPRTVDVFVEWQGQLKSTGNLRLDATFYKNGFSTNRFSVLYPLERSKKLRIIDESMRRQPEMVSGLELTSVAFSRGDTENEINATLQLEGADPGKVYLWRLLEQREKDWISSEVIRVEAPTCPVDFIDEQ